MSKAENKKSKDVVKGVKGDKSQQKGGAKAKTSQEMMRNHITDEKDVISDEDFRNLKMDFDLPDDAAHQPLVIEKDPKHPKDEDKDPDQIITWDLIK